MAGQWASLKATHNQPSLPALCSTSACSHTSFHATPVGSGGGSAIGEPASAWPTLRRRTTV
jgi:hypothetical protein